MKIKIYIISIMLAGILVLLGCPLPSEQTVDFKITNNTTQGAGKIFSSVTYAGLYVNVPDALSTDSSRVDLAKGETKTVSVTWNGYQENPARDDKTYEAKVFATVGLTTANGNIDIKAGEEICKVDGFKGGDTVNIEIKDVVRNSSGEVTGFDCSKS